MVLCPSQVILRHPAEAFFILVFVFCYLKFLIAATPGSDLTLYESGRIDIIGILCSEQ